MVEGEGGGGCREKDLLFISLPVLLTLLMLSRSSNHCQLSLVIPMQAWLKTGSREMLVLVKFSHIIL